MGIVGDTLWKQDDKLLGFQVFYSLQGTLEDLHQREQATFRLILFSEALNDFPFEDDLIGLFESKITLYLHATLEVELDDGDAIPRFDELIEDVLCPFDLVLPDCLLVLYYVPAAVCDDDVLSLKAWAGLQCEFHELGFDLLGDLAVVESFEWDHLAKDLCGLEIGWIYFELEQSLPIVCVEQEADGRDEDVVFKAILELQKSLIVLLEGFAAGNEQLR